MSYNPIKCACFMLYSKFVLNVYINLAIIILYIKKSIKFEIIFLTIHGKNNKEIFPSKPVLIFPFNTLNITISRIYGAK